MKLDDFFEMRDFISIAHHVPGRIRLKFDPRIITHPYAKALSAVGQKKENSGLVRARLNLMARSLVLEYDTARISPKELEDFLGGKDKDEAARAAKKVAALFGLKPG